MHSHDKDAQTLIHNLIVNLNDWIETYDMDIPSEKEHHTNCREGYIIIRNCIQNISLLLEKDNCA